MKMKETINFHCYHLYINQLYYSNKAEVEIPSKLTGSHISLCHVTGRCFLLAAGNTPINCSNGRNWTKKFGIFKNKVTCIFFPYQIINHKNYQYMHMWAIKNFACIN